MVMVYGVRSPYSLTTLYFVFGFRDTKFGVLFLRQTVTPFVSHPEVLWSHSLRPCVPERRQTNVVATLTCNLLV